MFTSACGGAWVGRVWVGVGVGERGEQHPPWEPLRYSGSGSGPADAFGFQLFHNRNIKAAAGDAGQLQLELCRLFYFYPAAPATPSPVPPPVPPRLLGGCGVDLRGVWPERPRLPALTRLFTSLIPP